LGRSAEAADCYHRAPTRNNRLVRTGADDLHADIDRNATGIGSRCDRDPFAVLCRIDGSLDSREAAWRAPNADGPGLRLGCARAGGRRGCPDRLGALRRRPRGDRRRLTRRVVTTPRRASAAARRARSPLATRGSRSASRAGTSSRRAPCARRSRCAPRAHRRVRRRRPPSHRPPPPPPPPPGPRPPPRPPPPPTSAAPETPAPPEPGPKDRPLPVATPVHGDWHGVPMALPVAQPAQPGESPPLAMPVSPAPSE